MTDKERADLERAIDRAGRLGLEVVAHGRRKADNAHIYCVPSASEHNRWHVVVRFGSRLVCDCAAGQHNRICVHRAAVYVHLYNAAERRRWQAEEVERALLAAREEETERALHEATRHLNAALASRDEQARTLASMPEPSRESPRAYSDNRAVGIYK